MSLQHLWKGRFKDVVSHEHWRIAEGLRDLLQFYFMVWQRCFGVCSMQEELIPEATRPLTEAQAQWLITARARRSFHIFTEVTTSRPLRGLTKTNTWRNEWSTGMRKIDDLSRLRMWLVRAGGTQEGSNSEDNLQASPPNSAVHHTPKTMETVQGEVIGRP